MIRFYMDVHVPAAITKGLRIRGVDVLTAQEDGFQLEVDPRVLERCAELRRVLFTRDRDFIKIVNSLSFAGRPFAGVFFAYSKATPFARIIDDLLLIANTSDWEEWQNRFEVIPL